MKKDGGSAFPHFQKEYLYNDDLPGGGSDVQVPVDGMSLRDWFAGKSISGKCVSGYSDNDTIRETLAENAYALADAMIREREKGS